MANLRDRVSQQSEEVAELGSDAFNEQKVRIQKQIAELTESNISAQVCRTIDMFEFEQRKAAMAGEAIQKDLDKIIKCPVCNESFGHSQFCENWR